MKNTILVVEDEQDTADLLKSILERDGYAVVHVKDGRQAIALTETIRCPSLILLDMVVPYVNGFELLGVIRSHSDWQQVPVIMVSANSYPPDIQRALAEGATDYLIKSDSQGELLKKIRKVLGSPPESSGAEGLPESDGRNTSPPRRKARQRARNHKRSDKAA